MINELINSLNKELINNEDTIDLLLNYSKINFIWSWFFFNIFNNWIYWIILLWK